ncbi:rRNA maturation RNase YbeY [Occallatibacter savannae]|uniref:rRNA maturation RNase YbeY n=1 Tax=Occallatibacter savannae TaxID=1002691 RepID=UPI000D691D19|nr:rRNA maturation RNase YbeY [Occallatibacter savannae]
MIILDPDLETDRSSTSLTAGRRRSAVTPSRAQSQSNRIPSARTLVRFLREAQSVVKLRGQVSVLLTTDKEIRRLNRTFRGKNKATDVLSFPSYVSRISKSGRYGAPRSLEIAGDLAISVDTARRQAARIGHSVSTEIKVLMLHGLLHLAGYDHETDAGEMARLEERLRAKLRLPHGLIERAEGLPFPAHRKSDERGTASRRSTGRSVHA